VEILGSGAPAGYFQSPLIERASACRRLRYYEGMTFKSRFVGKGVLRSFIID
jgi:hypothetical protein